MVPQRTIIFVGVAFLNAYLGMGSLLHAQQIRRDQQAIAVLQQAIAAMGGAGNISGITTASLSGHLTWYHEGQRSTRQFTTEYRFADSVAFRHELTDDKGTSIFASGGQKPVFQAANGKTHRFGRHMALAAASFELPAVLLSRELANPNCALVYVDGGQGQPLHVRTDDQTNNMSKAVTRQDWYFDPNSTFPIRVVYKLPDVNSPSIHTKTTSDYVGFQTVTGVAVPTEIQTYMDGQLDNDFIVETTLFNVGLAQNFDMPEN